MSQLTSLENFISARYALRSINTADGASAELKKQLLDFLDIAEQEKQRLLERCEAISSEQQQIEMALCHTEDAISITSVDGNIRLVNPAFEVLTGYCGSEIIGYNHDRLWNTTERHKVEKMNEITASGSDWQGEMSIMSRTGSLLDVQVSVVPIIHHTGKITHFVFTLHNITARIRLERHLNRQKQFLEKVINLNPSIIIILDENGEWMLDNLAAKTLISDMGEGSRRLLSSLLLSNLKKARQASSPNFTITMPNGSEVTFMMFSEEIPARYLLPESEQKEAYLITLSDITEIEKKNREILIRQKALLSSRIEKNLIQGEFVNGFIYHLQKPLNIVKAAISRLQVALKQKRTDSIEQSVGLLDHELEFLEKELMKFRTMQQSYPESPEITESTELLEATRILYQDHIRTGRISLENSSTDTIIFPLPYEIMQLLLKILIDNGLESDPNNSELVVKIRINKGKNGAILIVEDSGPGIPKSDRYKVFEPFFTTKHNRQGLSLTILHQLLNKIRGSVDLSSSSLGGVKMTLYFPMES